MDYSTIKEIGNLNINSMAITLTILVSINIVIEVIKFVFSLCISAKDKNNKRELLIEEKRINVLEMLFKQLDSLTLYFSDSDEDKMLSDLKAINLYISQNRIYIPKNIYDISISILDYFRKVLTDFREKSIERESELFEKFCNEFSRHK